MLFKSMICIFKYYRVTKSSTLSKAKMFGCYFSETKLLFSSKLVHMSTIKIFDLYKQMRKLSLDMKAAIFLESLCSNQPKHKAVNDKSIVYYKC